MKMNELRFLCAAVSLVGATACDDLTPRVRPGDGGVQEGNVNNVGIPIDLATANTSIVQGAITDLYGSRVTTWLVLDANKVVTAFRWNLPLASVQSVPLTTSSLVRVWIKTPDAAVLTQTTFQGLAFDYLPVGHAPVGIYDTPHWEFHMIGIPYEDVATVDCSDPKLPPDELLPIDPPGWLMIPPPDNCVAGMGMHAVNPSFPEFNKQRFTKTILPAYYHGKFASVEPKITRDLLLARKNIEMDVPYIPTPRATLFPTKFTAVYDQPTDSYVMGVSGFKESVVRTAP
jgi:hypothetical protein